MYTGPKLENEDLEFGYDTGRGVLSNHVSSRFYPGEPTVNYVTDSPTGGGWGGGHDVIDSATKTFKFKVQNFTANPGSGWRSFTWDMTSHAGSAVTISATFEYAGPVGQMAFVYIGQGNTYTNNSGAGGYLGYSPASDRTSKTTETKERISWSGTIGSGGSANQPSGHIGITVWINNGVPAGNGNYDSYIVMSNIQIEKKAHATPFVNGTRSSTQGLIDLKRTASIDLSDVSFDSNGLVEFDGTDDDISLNNASSPTANMVSVELVAKFDSLPASNSYMSVFQKQANWNNAGGVMMQFIYNGFRWSYGNAWTGAVTYAQSNFTTGKYYHIVGTVLDVNGNDAKLYINGEQVGSTGTGSTPNTTSNLTIGLGNGGRLNGNIDVFKMYSQTLSADQIKQNYNAYKNRFNI